MTEFELNNFFSQFGLVKDSKIITDRNGVSKGWRPCNYTIACIGAGLCWSVFSGYNVVTIIGCDLVTNSTVWLYVTQIYMLKLACWCCRYGFVTYQTEQEAAEVCAKVSYSRWSCFRVFILTQHKMNTQGENLLINSFTTVILRHYNREYRTVISTNTLYSITSQLF